MRSATQLKSSEYSQKQEPFQNYASYLYQNKLALSPRLTEYIPHYPTPKQAAFLLLDCRDAFYGGGAGGGKSDALLMAALQWVDVPGYAALLLRDTYKNLTEPEALMSRAEEWVAGQEGARWRDKRACWEFSTGGDSPPSTLSFGYLNGPRDHLNYKSAAYQFIGVDESTDLRWNQIRYMFSRLRRLKDVTVPLRFRCASNPGGISHKTHYQHYIDDKTRKKKVCFIPALMYDNPYLDVETYSENLDELDGVTRAQLKKGDWLVNRSGRLFRREWFEIVQEAPITARRVRYWDLAATEKKDDNEPSWTVGVRMSRTPEGLVFIEDMQETQSNPGRVEMMVRMTADLDSMAVNVRMEQEPGSAGKNNIHNYRTKVLSAYNFKGDRPSGPKDVRLRPFIGQAEAGNVYIVAGLWNERYMEMLEDLPDLGWDHGDATSGAYNYLVGGRARARIR